MTSPDPAPIVSAVVMSHSTICESVVELTLQPQSPFSFVAGQYLELESPVGTPWRPFSIASPPEQSTLRLLIRLNDNRFSGYVRSLSVGETVHCRGPHGRFLFHPSPRGAAFIANGTGIAPFLSVLTSASFNRLRPVNVVVMHGAQSPETLLGAATLAQLHKVAWYPVVAAADSGWQGRRGTVHDVVRELAPSWTDWDYYICGSPEFVRDIVMLVGEHGVPAAQIFIER